MVTSYSDQPAVTTRRRPDRDVIRAGYLAIACEILRRALLDARKRDHRAAAARRWLASDPWAAELIEVLDAGVDRHRLLEWIGELEPVQQRVLAL